MKFKTSSFSPKSSVVMAPIMIPNLGFYLFFSCGLKVDKFEYSEYKNVGEKMRLFTSKHVPDLMGLQVLLTLTS